MAPTALLSAAPALPMHYPGFTFRTLRDEGIGAEALLAGTGLSEALLCDPDHRCDFPSLHRFYCNVLAASGDPHVGVRLARRFRASYVGLPFLTAMNANTFEEAIKTLARLLHLTFPAMEFDGPIADVTGTAEECGVCIRPTLPLGEIAYFGASSALIVGDILFRSLLQAPQITLRAEIAVRKPQGWDELAQEIPFPVHFGAERNLLVFPASLLSAPLPSHDPLNLRQLLGLCDQLAAQLRPDDAPANQVMRVFEESGDFSVSIAEVAAALGCSERGLRRQLARAGTSYRQLLREARYSKARQLLADPTQSVQTIAFALGFDTPSNFARSFKEWSGVAPTEFRALARAADIDGQI